MVDMSDAEVHDLLHAIDHLREAMRRLTTLTRPAMASESWRPSSSKKSSQVPSPYTAG